MRLRPFTLRQAVHGEAFRQAPAVLPPRRKAGRPRKHRPPAEPPPPAEPAKKRKGK
jgi:hypothetical protein